MAAEPSPAFQFYPKDFLTSSTVRLMSMEARGVYITLLAMSWLDGALPTSVDDLAKLAGCSARKLKKIWPNIANAFTLTDAGYVNIRLEKEREKQRGLKAESSEKGRKGAEARWHGHSPGISQPMPEPDATATAQAMPDDSFSIAIADRKEEKNAQARVSRSGGSVLSGSLHRDHLDHAKCSLNFAWCVPNRVHATLAGKLAPKHGGDVDAAKDALLAWYPTVWASLPEGTVLGDAFKFWGPRFDAAFASTVTVSAPSKPRNCQHVPTCVDDVEHTRRKMREAREVGA